MFAKKPPTLTQLPTTIAPQAATAIEQVIQTQLERDELLAENSRLKAELEQTGDKIAFYKEQLRISDRRKDMYRRHAVSLFTRLNDIVPSIRTFADTLEKALQQARVEATNGNAVERHEPRDLDAGIRDIVSDLNKEPQA